MKQQNVLSRLAAGGPERQAIEAGEIDAVVDYASGNVILLPAARRALRKAADRASAANPEAAGEVSSANRLLSALPRAEYQRLLLGSEPLTLKFGEVLHEPGQPIEYVYFPIDCVVCLLATAERSRALGIGLVGREGMIGVSLTLGVKESSVRASVQTTGTALRIKAEHFEAALRECPALQQELHRYAHAKLALARRAIACNNFHAAEARLATLLLMTSDRGELEGGPLTQVWLAKMLGVRRATVNEAGGRLQRRKLIAYSRGKIRILDQEGLKTASCGCYTQIVTLPRRSFSRTLHGAGTNKVTPCKDCLTLVGAGRRTLPHASLLPAPQQHDDRRKDVLSCRLCNVLWRLGPSGWSQMVRGSP